MTPCCRFARSLIPFAALLPLSPLLFCVYLYWFIILPPSPTGVTISAYSALSIPFVILLICFVCLCPNKTSPACHLVLRPVGSQKAIEPEDQYLTLSQTCSLVICVAALFPLALAAASLFPFHAVTRSGRKWTFPPLGVFVSEGEDRPKGETRIKMWDEQQRHPRSELLFAPIIATMLLFPLKRCCCEILLSPRMIWMEKVAPHRTRLTHPPRPLLSE